MAARPKLWSPTMNLQFVHSITDDGTNAAHHFKLQQQWWKPAEDDETVGQREWRDVEMIDDPAVPYPYRIKA